MIIKPLLCPAISYAEVRLSSYFILFYLKTCICYLKLVSEFNVSSLMLVWYSCMENSITSVTTSVSLCRRKRAGITPVTFEGSPDKKKRSPSEFYTPPGRRNGTQEAQFRSGGGFGQNKRRGGNRGRRGWRGRGGRGAGYSGFLYR